MNAIKATRFDLPTGVFGAGPHPLSTKTTKTF